MIGINGKVYLQHRVIWALVHGYWSENEIDHINRNRADNSLCNLREVTRSCNMRNSGLRTDNKSGVKGVMFHTGINRWCCTIRCEGKRINVLTTLDKVEAVAARLAAEQQLSWRDCDTTSTAKRFMCEYLSGIIYEPTNELSGRI